MSGVPITVIISVLFEDVLVLFSLQKLNFLCDHSTYVHGLALLLIHKNALMYIKRKVKFITSLLSAYFNAHVYNAVYNACLTNAVCLYNAFLFNSLLQMHFVFMLYLVLLTHSLFIPNIVSHHA